MGSTNWDILGLIGSSWNHSMTNWEDNSRAAIREKRPNRALEELEGESGGFELETIVA